MKQRDLVTCLYFINPFYLFEILDDLHVEYQKCIGFGSKGKLNCMEDQSSPNNLCTTKVLAKTMILYCIDIIHT